MADGAFEWDDLGSWTALERHLKKDPNGNCIVGTALQIDASANIVFDARTKTKTPIALLGICNAIIVFTDDAVLMANKDRAQEIKQLVALLSQRAKTCKLI
jgi:mannose-1-phosphate guanylyltransferase